MISGKKVSVITALAKKQVMVAFIFPRHLLKLWDHCPGFHSSLLGAHIFFSWSQAGSSGECCYLESENGAYLLQSGWWLGSSGRGRCSSHCLPCRCCAGRPYQGWAPKTEPFLKTSLEMCVWISLLLTRERLCLAYFIISWFYFWLRLNCW